MYAAFQLDLEKAIRQGLIRSGDFEKTAQQIVRMRWRFSLESAFLRWIFRQMQAALEAPE